MPQKKRPRGRLWLNDAACVRLRTERANPKESVKIITKPFDFRKQVQEQIAIAQAVK